MLLYLTNIRELQKNTVGTSDAYLLAVAQAAAYENTGELEEYLSDASDYLTALLAIPAPDTFVLFHLGLANVWQKRIAIGKAILEGDTDAMKPLAALQELATALDEEIVLEDLLEQALQKTFSG